MDDVNINKICLGIEEVELDGDEWVKLSWISNQSDNDGNFQSLEIQKDLDNEIDYTKDYNNKVSVTNTEPEDISDSISVITESDTDTVNTNFFQICQFNRKPYRPLQMLETQKNLLNILIACVLGIIIGLALSHLFTIRKTCSISSGVDAESFKTASHNIVNTCKELTDMKTMLNEIKTHIPADKKITKQFLAQFFKITDSFNNPSNKSIILTKEFFNSTPYSSDQLQISLHILSSLASIYDNNGTLKNEINKTLDIVNSTKAFYDTLVLFNNTQDVFAPMVLNFLQHNTDKMHNTSKLLLSNLIEKVSKVTSKVYNKYAKERHRLNKKLCHLKSILPDDKFLKQLTENNQLFKDYDKSCFSNYTSKSLDSNTTTKGNIKVKSVKEQIIKTDDTMLHTKYDKKNTHKIHDNRESFLKNKRNKRQNIDKSMKFLQNATHKIHNVSQLLVSKIVESISKLRYQLSKKLHHLKNILPDNSEFLKQLTEDDEEDNKESVKRYEEKNDYLQLNIISKNNFDNILMQLKNTCPLSTNYCPKFNINMSTFDTVSNHKTKNYISKKHDTNCKKTVMDHGNSVKILPREGKNRPSKKDYFKSNGFTKKIFNDKSNYEGKDISSQNKIKNHISEHTDNHHKPKHSSFDSRTMKQDNQYYTDRRSKRFHEYRKQRQFGDSDWYFRRAHSRRNARRRAEYIIQKDTKWFWKNRR